MNKINNLFAISPLDGRYRKISSKLSPYFSEYAFLKYRVFVEVLYFESLCNFNLEELKEVKKEWILLFKKIFYSFNIQDAEKIKNIETTTNHDVKAIEYFLRDELNHIIGTKTSFPAFIHFGLTSQDINSVANGIMIMDAINKVLLPTLNSVKTSLKSFCEDWVNICMISHTHGQPASPTSFGKEIGVFYSRIDKQIKQFDNFDMFVKFGGACGNMNAHKFSYPEKDWLTFADDFVQNFGLKRSYPTTQIDHQDNTSMLFHIFIRINNILIDFCRDMWMYGFKGYLNIKKGKNEIGSSTMPHKTNPINFENAEGNLLYANSIFTFMANTIPISRLQRDLTDSTILRNLGVPMAHTLIAFENILLGLNRISPNLYKINRDMDENSIIIVEGIQTLLRKNGFVSAYEDIKDMIDRGVELKKIIDYVISIPMKEEEKEKIKNLSVKNYNGYYETIK